MFSTRRTSLYSLLLTILIITLYLSFPRTASASNVPVSVLLNCPSYTEPGNISNVVLYYNNQVYPQPDNVMQTIARWQGMSEWSGYGSANPLGLPTNPIRSASL